MLRNNALSPQIVLVSDDDHGERVPVLDPKNLLLVDPDFLKTFPRVDRENEQEAFAGAHVLLAHGRVLFLAGGI